MFAYYTATIFLNVFAMLILQLCITKSNTLTRERKKLFRALFALIAIAAFCEWFGVFLQGKDPSTRYLHIAIKIVELSVAPSIAFIFSWVIEKKWEKIIIGYLGIHFLAECLSAKFGLIYYVDENNHYYHADFYWIYVVIYLISILYSIFIVARNVKKFQYNGISVFLMTAVLMLTGIAIQLWNSDLKVDYVTLGIASTMIYVFTLEMIQQTDELTELLNRRGYENYIMHMDRECLVVFFDVDRFKMINDTYGHAFGDFVLKKIGTAMKKNYAKNGKCFRYGGDEFCVILTKNLEKIEDMNHNFLKTMEKQRATERKIPTVSIGYAYFDPKKESIQDAIEKADKMMYENKAARKSDKKF